MRKYTLADGQKRNQVDLRDYEDIIVTAVHEFAPGIEVTVCKDYYTLNEQLTQSQAVKIGRKICESDLKYHCIKLSKLFNSKPVKEKANDNSKEQKCVGGHH
jgi:hypothetical protein